MRILQFRLSRFGAAAIALVIAAFVIICLASPAHAAAAGVPSADAPAIVNIFDTAQLIALVAGVVIPFVVALLTNASASDNVKALFAFLAAGLTGLGAYLLDANGAHTWKGAVSVFVVAVVVAAASRVTLTGHLVARLQAKKGLVG